MDEEPAQGQTKETPNHGSVRAALPVNSESARMAGMFGVLSILSFVVGVGCGVLVLVLFYVKHELTQVLAEQEARRTTVPVLIRTLGPGTIVEASDIRLKKVEKVLVPRGALRHQEEIVGRTVRERILNGEYFRVERLAPKEAMPGLSAIIPSGARAVQLNLQDNDRVAGFIEPGNLVDLVVTIPDRGGLLPETVTVAQGVVVLAMDERISTTATGERIKKPSVTLSIPLPDIERVVHAVFAGESKLTLRSDIDFEYAQTTGTESGAMLGRPSDRMTTSEFRAKYNAADVEQWTEIIAGGSVKREKVDPHLLRGIGKP